MSCLGLQAQQLVRGRVLENQTRLKLAGVRVENLNNKQSTLTDNEGIFSVKAEKNQLLVFKVLAYQPDTVLITSYVALEIFLSLQTRTLQSVTVNASSGPASFGRYDPYFHGQTVAYQTDANGFFKGGLSLRFWYWKKDERKRARKEKLTQRENQEAHIAKIFNPQTLAQYLPLQAAEMQQFIFLYTPSPKVYFNNDFNLVMYLENCYKKFNHLPASEHIPVSADSLKQSLKD